MKTNEEIVEEIVSNIYKRIEHDPLWENWLRQQIFATLEAKDKECDERVREAKLTITKRFAEMNIGVEAYVGCYFDTQEEADAWVEKVKTLTPTKTGKQTEV